MGEALCIKNNAIFYDSIMKQAKIELPKLKRTNEATINCKQLKSALTQRDDIAIQQITVYTLYK